MMMVKEYDCKIILSQVNETLIDKDHAGDGPGACQWEGMSHLTRLILEGAYGSPPGQLPPEVSRPCTIPAVCSHAHVAYRRTCLGSTCTSLALRDT